MTKPAEYDWQMLNAIAIRMHDRDASLDEILASLRSAGAANPLICLKVLHDALGLSHREAKVAAFTSPVWSDAKVAHDQLEADIEAVIHARSPHDIHRR